MHDENQKLYILIVSGNRRDKFINWITKICPEYRLYEFSSEVLARHRYRKYCDLKRYPDEKYLKIMNKSFPMAIEFIMSAELRVIVSLLDYKKSSNNKSADRLLRFFENCFKANINWNISNENYNMTNLRIQSLLMSDFVPRFLNHTTVIKNTMTVKNE